MIALDTNVIVRVVTQDDPEQSALAQEAMARENLWVSKTVLLETAWVLSYSYGLDRATVARTLRLLVGYSNVTVEDRQAVVYALDWHAEGMDLADALHLASNRQVSEFVTFDRKLASVAGRIAGTPRVRLLTPPNE